MSMMKILTSAYIYTSIHVTWNYALLYRFTKAHQSNHGDLNNFDRSFSILPDTNSERKATKISCPYAYILFSSNSSRVKYKGIKPHQLLTNLMQVRRVLNLEHVLSNVGDGPEKNRRASFNHHCQDIVESTEPFSMGTRYSLHAENN